MEENDQGVCVFSAIDPLGTFHQSPVIESRERRGRITKDIEPSVWNKVMRDCTNKALAKATHPCG